MAKRIPVFTLPIFLFLILLFSAFAESQEKVYISFATENRIFHVWEFTPNSEPGKKWTVNRKLDIPAKGSIGTTGLAAEGNNLFGFYTFVRPGSAVDNQIGLARVKINISDFVVVQEKLLRTRVGSFRTFRSEGNGNAHFGFYDAQKDLVLSDIRPTGRLRRPVQIFNGDPSDIPVHADMNKEGSIASQIFQFSTGQFGIELVHTDPNGHPLDSPVGGAFTTRDFIAASFFDIDDTGRTADVVGMIREIRQVRGSEYETREFIEGFDAVSFMPSGTEHQIAKFKKVGNISAFFFNCQRTVSDADQRWGLYCIPKRNGNTAVKEIEIDADSVNTIGKGHVIIDPADLGAHHVYALSGSYIGDENRPASKPK